MRFLVIIGFLLTGLMALFSFDTRHDFHTSLTEMRFNPETGSLETTVRLFTDDLENALSTANKRTVKLKDADADKLVRVYIQKHLAFVKGNEVVLAEYIGKEVEPDVSWVYLEYKEAGKLKGLDLLNSIFTELFDDQSNLVNIIYPDTRKTLLFNQKKKLLPFEY